MSDIDRELHDPLEQNMDENAAEAEVTEMIVDEAEVTSAEESAMHTDTKIALDATEATEGAEKKHKNRESTSEKAKRAAAERAARGEVEKAKRGALNPLRLRSKKYREMIKLVDKNTQYSLADAVDLVKKTSIGKFDSAVELHAKIKVETTRGTLALPHGTGKTKKVAVADDATLEALAAGKMDFDVLLATPAQMPKLAKFAKVLGPKGLMPSPKAGTVTTDIEKVTKEISGGRIEYRADKNGVIHLSVGRVSFTNEQLVENIEALLAVLINAKIQTLSLASTMGPGVRVRLG